jgi:hypothetical protein
MVSFTHRIGGWVGPRVESVWTLCHAENRTPAVQPVARRYTDWADISICNSFLVSRVLFLPFPLLTADSMFSFWVHAFHCLPVMWGPLFIYVEAACYFFGSCHSGFEYRISSCALCIASYIHICIFCCDLRELNVWFIFFFYFQVGRISLCCSKALHM